MLQLRTLGLGTLIIAALASPPLAAQTRDGVSSLTHVVSVTVPARVKVKVTSMSLMTVGSVPVAVKFSTLPASIGGLALTVHSNQAWVLSVSASAGSAAKGSRMLWSGTQTGKFTAISAADSLLAAGLQSPASVDTTVFFRGPTAGSETSPVMLTVSAP